MRSTESLCVLILVAACPLPADIPEDIREDDAISPERIEKNEGTPPGEGTQSPPARAAREDDDVPGTVDGGEALELDAEDAEAEDAEAENAGEVLDLDEDSPDELEPDEEEVLLDLEEVDTSELSPFSFRGVLDLTFVHYESDENVDGFDENEILPLHPMLLLRYRFHERFAGVLEIEWEGIQEEFEIEQLYVEWTVVEKLLNLGVGRHVLPFGVFRFYHSPMTNDFVNEPAVFRTIYPEVNPDLGLFARGEYVAEEFSVGYEVSVSNGLHGPSRQAAWGDLTDNNDSKWFTGRLSFAPAESLTLGVSYSGGQYDRDDKLLADFLGFDVQYRVGGFRLKAEWIGGLVERSRTAGGDYHRHGWYVELGRPWAVDAKYLEEVETLFRYDDLDANNKVRDRLDLRRYSFGVNLVFNDHLRWKLQYEINDERHDDIANDGFLTQLEFHW